MSPSPAFVRSKPCFRRCSRAEQSIGVNRCVRHRAWRLPLPGQSRTSRKGSCRVSDLFRFLCASQHRYYRLLFLVNESTPDRNSSPKRRPAISRASERKSRCRGRVTGRVFSVRGSFRTEVWLRTHPELRRTERIRLLMDHLVHSFREESRLEGVASVFQARYFLFLLWSGTETFSIRRPSRPSGPDCGYSARQLRRNTLRCCALHPTTLLRPTPHPDSEAG